MEAYLYDNTLGDTKKNPEINKKHMGSLGLKNDFTVPSQYMYYKPSLLYKNNTPKPSLAVTSGWPIRPTFNQSLVSWYK